MRLETSIDDIPLIKELEQKFTGDNFLRLKRNILALMFTQMITRFDNESDYKGNKWQPLKEEQFERRNKKIKNKKKKGQIKILQDDGTLRQSWTEEGAAHQEITLTGNEVILGSNVEYVRAHDEGMDVPHPGTSNGFGRGIQIPAHIIKMPQRQMSGFSEQDTSEISELVESFLGEANG